MIQPRPCLRNGGRVRQHADAAVHGRELGSRDDDRFLVVDAELEARGAPFDEVEGRFGFEGGDGLGAVAGDDVAAVEERDGHVFAEAGVADDHLVLRFEACLGSGVSGGLLRGRRGGRKCTLQGQVLDFERLVGALVRGDDRGEADKWVMDSRVRHQVRLELIEIDI